MTTSDANVHRVRDRARKAARAGRKPAKAATTAIKAPSAAKSVAKAAPPKPVKAAVPSSNSESALRRLVLEIGIGRTEAILADIRERVAKSFGAL